MASAPLTSALCPHCRSHNEDVALLAGEETTTEPLSVMDCLQIALQVAAGMKYLASQVRCAPVSDVK